ncbi:MULTISPECIES: protein rep [Bacteria]|uniref:protein rep n=1 Tax=Bacteria TaxID=2 RepID=UPI0007DAE94B
MANELLSDTSISGKEKPWTRRKKQTLKLSKVYEKIGEEKKALRVSDCGNYLTFNECPSGHKKQLTRAYFCKVRLCPLCSWRRSLKLVQQLKRVAHETNKQQKVKWLFLTLTVRNVRGSELPEEITNLFKAWQRLSQRKVFRNSVAGWFRALEVSRNNEDWTYHPHLHVLLAVKLSYFSGSHYISQQKWSELWQEALRVEYVPVVDIRKIRPKRNKESEFNQLKDIEKDKALEAAVVETAKYPIKPGSYLIEGDKNGTEEAIGSLDKALQNRRMIAYGGILKETWNHLLELDQIDQINDIDLHEGSVSKDCNCPTCGSNMLEQMYKWNIGIANYTKI